MKRQHDERVKQVAVGVTILLILAISLVGLLVGWSSLPGVLGQWIGTMLGVMMTPFFLEASFAVLGIIIVIALNIWRRDKEGDDLVFLEEMKGIEAAADIPDHAKWAVFKEAPLEGGQPSLLAQAEGAFALGDFKATAEWIAEMNHDELREPEALKLRHELALVTGKLERARELEEEISKH
jgi:hypothetical protein